MKEESELSYISALIKVIRSGCENDNSERMRKCRRDRLHNSSLRNEGKFRKSRQTFGDDLTSRSMGNDHQNDITNLNTKDASEKTEEEAHKNFLDVESSVHLESIA